MDELEKLAATAQGIATAPYVAADAQRIVAQLSNPATMQSAANELQKWADGPDGLRKAFAAKFLEQARTALGGMKPGAAIAQYGRKVAPGEAVATSAGTKARFAAAKTHQVASPSNHPAPKVEHGAAAARLDPHHKPTPRVQGGMMAHPRLKPPPPDAAVADQAHKGGAKLAGIAAKHGFKLGLSAAAALGAGGAIARHHGSASAEGKKPDAKVEKVPEAGKHVPVAAAKDRGEAAKARWMARKKAA